MKRTRKYLWSGLLIVLLSVVVYAYMEYNRKPADLSTMESQARISADSLTDIYGSDEGRANRLYLGKVIEVKGRIDEISNQQDTAVTLLLGVEGAMHRVSCLMSSNQLDHVKKYVKGQDITVRGICTGYLLDVELNRCVVVR